MVDNIVVCVQQRIQVFDVMKILMNVRFFLLFVETVERKLFDIVFWISSDILNRCVNEIGSYRCYCASGWYGSTCAKAVDNCLSQPCNRNGTCVNKVSLSLKEISSKMNLDQWIWMSLFTTLYRWCMPIWYWWMFNWTLRK